MNVKNLIYWIFGAFSITVGVLILGNYQIVAGVDAATTFLSIFVAFLAFLLGGLMWIGTAVSIKEN